MVYGSNFWRGKQYQQLAELRLPGPSVVIDVRRGTDHDPPLIWNLGIELDDLSTEMDLNQVYRWRYLTNCIDFLKLAPVDADDPEKELVDFVLTSRTGYAQSFAGKKALLRELVIEHLDVVRTNRIGAGRDQGSADPDEVNVDPEQVTVRVFFLVDAEDTDSLVSAAIYAKWLKDSYHEYESFGRAGRDKRISTLAVCMNADPFIHHAYVLAHYLDYHATKGYPILDAVILLHTYGDNEAYIGGDIQSYQVELILYTLLLLSFESLIEREQDILGDQNLVPFILDEDYPGQMPLPWPIFLVGISSLEYSARWAGRWLDYGLVATIIEIIRETKEVDWEDKSGELRSEVQKKFDEWLQNVHALIFEGLIEAIPGLLVFENIQHYLATSPSSGTKQIDPVQELEDFCRNIRQFYIGTEQGSSLESSMEGAQLIPWQLERAHMRVSKSPEDAENLALMQELYRRLHGLQLEMAKLPASLFQHVRGMLPRALRQLSELTEMINKIGDVSETPPDMQKCLEQINQQVESERLLLQRAAHQRWSFHDRIARQRKESYTRLKAIIQDHIQQTQGVIVARVALVLLEAAGLYKPKGKLCLFQDHLRSIDVALKEAQKRATLQKQRAYKRLKVSLNQTQHDIMQTSPRLRLSLNNRRDWLNWAQIVEAFEIHSKELEATPTYLDLLMRWLLRLLGGEKPLDIVKHYLGELKAEDLDTQEANKLSRHEMHAYSTMLVAVLILFDTVGFDIASIQQLLDKYARLKSSAFDEPSTLETNIMSLQSIIRDAKATRNTGESNNQKQLSLDFASVQRRTLELIVAAWVHDLCAEDPLLAQTLAQSGILTRLEENKISPAQAIKDLQARNRLLGYRDDLTGDDLYYLLLAPGEASNDFLKEAVYIHFAQIQAIRFPDAEKLIYLHIHRLRQNPPGFVSPSSQ